MPYHLISYRREDKTRLINKYHETSHLLILKLQNLWFYLISSIFNFITHTKGKLNHILLYMKTIPPLRKCTKPHKNPQNCTKLKKMHKNPQKTQKIPQNKQNKKSHPQRRTLVPTNNDTLCHIISYLIEEKTRQDL